MQLVKQKSNNNHNHPSSSKKKIINGDRSEIVELMAEKDKQKSLIEPGSHNLLIYNDLKTFREIYGQYSRAFRHKRKLS